MKYFIYKMNFLFLFSFILFSFSSQLHAQTESENKIKDEDYMNFWIGSWDLTWTNSDGSIDKGTNQVVSILNNKVIQENFKALTGKMAGFNGMSVSVYSVVQKKWYQTWVDNKGGYLDFVGKMDNNRRIFFRHFINKNHQEIIQRMVFYNINKKSFDWDWEISNDGGNIWQLKWRIHYKRHKL